jgi:hypothetical protein
MPRVFTESERQEFLVGKHVGVLSVGNVDSVLFTIRPDRWLTADFSADE